MILSLQGKSGKFKNNKEKFEDNCGCDKKIVVKFEG